ncbi:MAG: hypothetical protein LC808_03670 [Actinobacteria bacterium]|nr:hypothetical protein [Actinomycetota bacterium]
MASLPKPDEHGLPATATIAVPVPDEGLRVYRLVDGEAPTLRDFEERRTRPQAERDGIPELFRHSVSHWLRYEQAAAHSIRRRFYVAELELVPHVQVRVALTEEHGEGHVDVWAPPEASLAAVASTVHGFRRPYT